MYLSSAQLNGLTNLAIQAARKAGEYISITRPLKVQHKPDGDSLAAQVVTEVDEQSQTLILQLLEPSFAQFNLALLTEEREDDRERLEKDYFWCIDPIDGTLPFIEGVSGYAVSIALVSRSGIPQIGVIFDPVNHTLYHAIKGGGAFRNSTPWSQSNGEAQPRIFTDRSVAQQPYFSSTAKALGGASIETRGGAVMNAMWVLEHSPACYFKFPKANPGGGSLWDYAATACIFHEAGAIATDIHGEPLDLNRPDSSFMNHRGILYASNPDLASKIIALAKQCCPPTK